MKVSLTRRFEFHAAHALGTFPEGHKCRNLHGHTFKAEVVITGEVDPTRGYLIDFGEMKRLIRPLEEQLDHAMLNDIPGLEIPTAEMIAKWLYDQLDGELPHLDRVRVHETENNTAEYWGE